MSEDFRDVSGRLVDRSAVLAARSHAALDAAAGVHGEDQTGAIRVVLDGAGRAAMVRVAAGWKRRLAPDGLGAAVIEAARTAAVTRMSVWAQTFADDTPSSAAGAPIERDTLANQLQRIAGSKTMSPQDTQVALLELLALAQDIERGLDQISERLPAAMSAVYTGRSADQHVTVSLTASGEVQEVRYDRRWLAHAHEINIGRQTGSAFTAAYQAAARHNVEQVIASSPLGQVQQITQDPLGLARRLRLTD